MTNHRTKTAIASQRGFALMMVMFLTTLVLLGAMAAAPFIRTERQREKDEVLIWRGKQYVRGIKLYYRKTGRFPTSVDDLTKPKLGSLRFMRQAYDDPMNKADGSWRFIYVGPGGQLIGSLRPQQPFQLPGQPGAPVGANAQPAGFGASGFGQSAQSQAGGQQGAAPTGTNAGQTTPGSPASGAVSADDAAANTAPSGLVNADSPVIGGNIIGVGSKINKRSIIVYDKATNYRLFEFIWNPSKDLANAINQQSNAPNQNPQGPGQGQTGFGQSGFGQGFGQQNNPAATPPGTPTAAPAPSPTQNPPQQ